MHFYQRTLAGLISDGVLVPDDAVLVAAGGQFDRECCLAAGLTNVRITNLDHHAGRSDYAPFEWERQDCELIDLPDNSVEWAIIHAGLHHLAVPAKGVCELFRVARKGVLCIEARDSLAMKLAIKAGLTSDFELEPALLSGGVSGGYRNGPLPNYIYRWTEREFEKVVNSYAPSHQHKFFYHYGYGVPWERFAMSRNPLLRLAGRTLPPLAGFATKLLPKQGNQFAFGVLKNVRRQPWLTDSLAFKADYLANKYDASKYVPEKMAG